MVQRASEGFKHGDQNPDHVNGITLALDHLMQHKKSEKWIITTDWEEQFDWIFMCLNDFPPEKHDGFQCDIVVYEDVIFRGTEYKLPIVFVEIDGKKHDTLPQQIKDGIYDKWIYYHYNDSVEVVRLKTAEMNGPLDIAVTYIKGMLRAYCR